MKLGLSLMFVLLTGYVSISCQDAVAKCPVLTVTGPAGIWLPGETITFSAAIKGEYPKGISYVWSVDFGEIVSGQGTNSIKVLSRKDREPSLTATVSLLGLPTGCPDDASETAMTIIEPTYTLLASFRIQPVNINSAALTKLADHLRRSPNSYGYVIEYFATGTPQAVIKRKLQMTRDRLLGLGIPANCYRILSVNSKKYLTKIYAIPPGVDFPVP